MIPARCFQSLLLAVCLGAGSICLAQSDPAASGDDSDPGFSLPPGLEINFGGSLNLDEDGVARFSGPVTISWRDSRIQADTLYFRDQRHVVAEGNVLIVWGENRIFGSRMEYDLEDERGVIEDAVGYALDEYLMWGEKIEKIGHKKLRLTKATITTCNQPVPYWSFAVSSATITLEKYARMWNVRLRALKAPIIYIPYLIWPVKEDRAAGMLIPEYSSTSARGDVISVPIFIPLGRSADATLVGRNYSKAGFMGGGEVRFIPNLKGSGIFGGFFIDDQVEGKKRYRFDFAQTQEFNNGFRMVADAALVSDDQYYTDFERDLNVASAPQSLARLEFSRNGKWVSMNVRQLRREQLSSGLVQSTYPEIEWRGRSRKLGRTPFYLKFESSLASIQQESSTLDADYYRGDIAPEVSLPYSPTAWLDVTPSVAYRYTSWSQRLDPDSLTLDDQSLSRGLLSYGLEIVGPKLYRIYGEPGEKRYKHTLETQISYGFDEEFDRRDEVLSFDEIDQIAGAGTRTTYAIVQRLFAKRKQVRPPPPPTTAAGVVLAPDAEMGAEESDQAEVPVIEAPAVPVEVAFLRFSQAKSFDGDLSTADLDGDGIIDARSSRSDISMSGRVNPIPSVSFDLNSRYDILFDEVEDVSLSGTIQSRVSSARFSFFRRNGLGVNPSTLVPKEDSTQVQFTGGLNLIRDKLQIKLRTSYNADPAPGDSHFPEQRWQLQYSTQCCTFFVERLSRDFATVEERRELSFRIDLRGVGKLLTTTF